MVLNIPDFQQRFDVNGDAMVPGSHFANSEVGLVAYSCRYSTSAWCAPTVSLPPTA